MQVFLCVESSQPQGVHSLGAEDRNGSQGEKIASESKSIERLPHKVSLTQFSAE